MGRVVSWPSDLSSSLSPASPGPVEEPGGDGDGHHPTSRRATSGGRGRRRPPARGLLAGVHDAFAWAPYYHVGLELHLPEAVSASRRIGEGEEGEDKCCACFELLESSMTACRVENGRKKPCFRPPVCPYLFHIADLKNRTGKLGKPGGKARKRKDLRDGKRKRDQKRPVFCPVCNPGKSPLSQ